MSSSPSPLTRRGFTLIEVLVATAIMVIIVLAVVTIASDTFKAYDRVVANLTTQSEARSVLDAMEGDFQTAVMRRDGRCWMEVILPGGSGSNMPSGTSTLGDLQSEDHPIIMLFASPLDRPRWLPTASGTRTALKGDVCAVAYRFGQSSPFISIGQTQTEDQWYQLIYGVYRTIIDSENTYANALPLILSSVPLASSGTKKYPVDYWGPPSKTFHNYNTATPNDSRVLMDFNYSSPTPSWTLDQSNMIGSNIVAMNLIFWCRSNSSTATPVLRAICPKGASTDRYTSTIFDSTLRDPLTDVFTGRLQITSDSIYTDGTLRNYSLKAVEVSLTVLSPDGVKELRALQSIPGNFESGNGGSIKLKNSNDFKRIVGQYGINYTRYIRIISNGG
jgi:prepilin-type N-terminal cleavage/methylation domain-containing protein